jgi:hypothetical protein
MSAMLAQRFVQQRLAQLLGRNLHNMETGRQRNTHHFKGAWVVVGGLGQVECAHARLAAQQRYRAALNPVFAHACGGLGQRAFYIARCEATQHVIAIVGAYLFEPGNDVCIATGCKGAYLACDAGVEPLDL